MENPVLETAPGVDPVEFAELTKSVAALGVRFDELSARFEDLSAAPMGDVSRGELDAQVKRFDAFARLVARHLSGSPEFRSELEKL